MATAGKNTDSISIAKDFCVTSQDLAEALDVKIEEIYADIKAIEKARGRTPRTLTFLQPELVREILSKHGRSFKSKVISFQMLKGGVAKTTSALNFGWRASMYGARVLFIDLDQQANLTFALGVESENRPVWVDVVEKKSKITDTVVNLDSGVDLIPSSLNNSVLDRVLMNSQRNWSQAVKTPLQEVQGNYDLIIIDTAPNLSLINTAVTCASDEVVLPINPDKFSILGVEKHLADLQELKNEFGLRLETRILLTRFDGRESLSREILTQSIEKFEEQLMKHYIRTSSEIKNSVGSTKTIYSVKSNAKEDYDLVTRELLGWV